MDVSDIGKGLGVHAPDQPTAAFGKFREGDAAQRTALLFANRDPGVIQLVAYFARTPKHAVRIEGCGIHTQLRARSTHPVH